MFYLKPRNQKGFTIIEVLIVLAIAGLILIIIFLAVPSAQRSTRDNHRRRDLGKYFSALKEYQQHTNNINSPFKYVPGDRAEFNAFKSKYLGQEFSKYDIRLYGHDEQHDFDHGVIVDRIIYFPEHYCTEDFDDENGDGQIEYVEGPGPHPPYAFAVLIGMEGTKSYYCLDQGNKDYN